jgi:RNA-directed DNA polymerase
MERVQARVGDKRVLALVKAFLKAGILGEDRLLRESRAGTPQGSILSPLLSNVALSVLDEHIAAGPGGPAASQTERAKRRRHCLPNYRLVRYADDWCLMVAGTKDDAQALKEEIAAVLSTRGLRLSPEKTLITHIDEGLDFLGWRIQRHRKRGTTRQYVYNYPSAKALRAVTARCKAICRMNVSLPLAVLLHQLNPVLRGWTTYFRPGVSSRAFQHLRMIVWRQVFGWLRRKHPSAGWKELRRRFCDGRWWPRDGEVSLFNPGAVTTTRYRPRGTTIPSPWPSMT